MIEFSMTWWQFGLMTLVGNLVAYLCGVVVGKQQMMTLMLARGQMPGQMPQMPPMPGGR